MALMVSASLTPCQPEAHTSLAPKLPV